MHRLERQEETSTDNDGLGRSRPRLNRDFEEDLESAKGRVPEPPLKVGRILETDVVKEAMNQQPVQMLFDTVKQQYNTCVTIR